MLTRDELVRLLCERKEISCRLLTGNHRGVEFYAATEWIRDEPQGEPESPNFFPTGPVQQCFVDWEDGQVTNYPSLGEMVDAILSWGDVEER